MLFPKDKKALNRRGHILWALLLIILSFYFLRDYLNMSILFVMLHLPIFLFGAIMPDLIERPTNSGHRGILHKGIWLWIIPLVSGILFYSWTNYPRFHILSETLSLLSICLFFGGGWWSHLTGDALTSKLR